MFNVVLKNLELDIKEIGSEAFADGQACGLKRGFESTWFYGSRIELEKRKMPGRNMDEREESIAP
jgi:hypothetical protein